MTHVLDASAVLAFLQKETGWEIVQSAIEDSIISSINWSEVAQKAARKELDIVKTRSLLNELGLEIIDFSIQQAELAAELWSLSKPYGLSLADRACIVLGIERQLPVLTADSVWAKLNVKTSICILR